MIAAVKSYAWLIVAIVLLAALVGSFVAGKRYSDAIWQAKYESREAELKQKHADEIERQAHMNDLARREGLERVQRLQDAQADLQKRIDDLETEAAADPDADHLGINANAAKRIGGVR